MSIAHRSQVVFCAAGLMLALQVRLVQAQFSVSPTTIQLDRPEATQQVLATEQVGPLRQDLTRQVEFLVANPAIIRVDADGLVHPLSEGTTQLTMRRGNDPCPMTRVRGFMAGLSSRSRAWNSAARRGP